jgi:hydroxymethylpyrimidine/phosphomethylpyrimidine kinase
MRTVLTIAGSDSSAGAGVQADLKTYAALNVYGACAITAVTAQNTSGVTAVEPLDADLVTAQIEAVAGDMAIHATKTGMLATAAIVEAVVAAIEELELPLVVVDPVMVSTSGRRLLDDDGVSALTTKLLPLARVVTPNLPEAEALAGRRITSPASARDAARRIVDLGAAAVIITGGHSGPAWSATTEVVDVLMDGDELVELRTDRVDAPDVHGTGCTFASAVAAHLALGSTLPRAADLAQRYVAGGLRHALAVGRGQRVLDHFWQVRLKPDTTSVAL